MRIDVSRHPCFNVKAKHEYARLHLPVGPKCNVQCRFCNRKYDCVNESRPGVTSAVLTPRQALAYVSAYVQKRPVSVVGIAGPGDPFANPDETMETLRLVRKSFPGMILCVSTNGLSLYPWISELASLNVTHVTITVNAVSPDISEKIYAWIRPEKKPYRGGEAGEMMVERQLAAVTELKRHDIIVKINSIIVPGVNDMHMEEIAVTCSKLGADIFNPIPMMQNAGCEFSDIKEPSADSVMNIKREVARHIPVMHHCTRCRADAAGLLGENTISETTKMVRHFAGMNADGGGSRTNIAVSTREGLLINGHLGETEYFEIYTLKDGRAIHLESRKAPEKGGSASRWEQLSVILQDCSYLLCAGAGESPRHSLEKSGILVFEADGFIEDALQDIYSGAGIEKRKIRSGLSCTSGCTGGGGGCG